MKSIAEISLDMTSLFEAEVLVQLMLWRWQHPYAEDRDFANGLLEDASTLLRGAIQGEQIVEGILPDALNLVAAVWQAEQNAVELADADPDAELESSGARRNWLAAVRHTLPSCFCDQADLR